MAATRTKKDHSLRDMLLKLNGSADDNKAPTQNMDHPLDMWDQEGPMTRSFLEALFTSIWEDLQAIKKDLSADLREVRQNLEEVGDRLSTLEDCKSGWDEVLEWVQQEVLLLKEQHVELQAHAEDLENCFRWNNVCSNMCRGIRPERVRRILVSPYPSSSQGHIHTTRPPSPRGPSEARQVSPLKS
ncbi:hypothetical protein NDU88_001527 [Pleurodeles waltl]|uniref:Uncharacterized protein n=1 Tax=Pleurodeles waltl TaxID=8319 RepID=A0AAV7MKR6_PLEWA|nr:hypothetical protein NDU88_001527 [Pleurodeles waltl]